MFQHGRVGTGAVKGRKGIKRKLGVRLEPIEDEVIRNITPTETLSAHASNLLQLGLIAHDPSKFEIVGALGGPRPWQGQRFQRWMSRL